MASSATLSEDSTQLLAPSNGFEDVAPSKVANEDMQVEQRQAKPGQHVQVGSAVNSESNSALDLAPVKPKRPKSAYFIFMNEVRNEIKAKFPTWGIGEIGKETGRLWNELPEEKKAEYNARRIPLIAQYEKDMEKYNEDLKRFEAAKFGPDGALGPPRILDILPLARVRKIMKLDKEVKNASKEAALMMQWCTELFLGQLTDEAYGVCKKQRKKMIKYEDISATVRKNEQMLFLAQDFPPINRRSKASSKSNTKKTKTTDKEQSNTINTFFAPVPKSESSISEENSKTVVEASENVDNSTGNHATA